MDSAGEQAQREAERDLWDADTGVEALSRDQLAALADGPRDKAILVVLYAPWCPYSQVLASSGFLCAISSSCVCAMCVAVYPGKVWAQDCALGCDESSKAENWLEQVEE